VKESESKQTPEMSLREAVIRSVKDGTTLTISLPDLAKKGFDNTIFEALLEGPDIRARCLASTYFAGSPALLFREMAKRWRGWEGDLKWAALENEMVLAARTDARGHVILEVSLRAGLLPPDWKVTAFLHLEAGSLEGLWNRIAAVLPIPPNANYQ
jgi:hypothetical protein